MRILVAFLALAAVLSLSGCSGGEVSAEDAKDWGKANGVPADSQPDRDR